MCNEHVHMWVGANVFIFRIMFCATCQPHIVKYKCFICDTKSVCVFSARIAVSLYFAQSIYLCCVSICAFFVVIRPQRENFHSLLFIVGNFIDSRILFSLLNSKRIRQHSLKNSKNQYQVCVNLHVNKPFAIGLRHSQNYAAPREFARYSQ